MNHHEVVLIHFVCVAAFGIVGPIAATILFFRSMEKDEKRHEQEMKSIGRTGEKNG